MELTTAQITRLQALQDAVNDMAHTFRSMGTAESAQHLTCTELDALARVLSVAGWPEAARSFVEAHAASDEEGDAHEHLTTDGRITVYVNAL